MIKLQLKVNYYDSINTGTLNEKEAREMALEFIRVANELTEFAKEDFKDGN